MKVTILMSLIFCSSIQSGLALSLLEVNPTFDFNGDTSPRLTSYSGSEKDCEESDQEEQLDKMLSTFNNMNDSLTCRSEIVSAPQDKKRYCDCVKRNNSFPIDKQYIKLLESKLGYVAESFQTEDLLVGYLDVKEVIDRIIKQTTTFNFTDVEDYSVLCRDSDINKILDDMKNPSSKCGGGKFDKVLGLLQKNGTSMLGGDANIEKLIKDLPKSYTNFRTRVDENMDKIEVHSAALEKAITEVILLLNKPILPDDLDKRIEVFSSIFANDPLFKKIKIKFPNGKIVNPQGVYDVTTHLKDINETPENLAYTSFGHMATALKKGKVDLGENPYVTRQECQDIKDKLDLLCEKVVDKNNYLQKMAEDDPQKLLTPITDYTKLELNDLLIAGALQCVGAGLGQGMLDADTEAYLKTNLSFLLKINPKTVGNFLGDDKYYEDLIYPIMSSGTDTVKKLQEQSKTTNLKNRVADTVRQDSIDKNYKRDLDQIARRDSDGNIQIDSSKGLLSSRSKHSILSGLSSYGKDPSVTTSAVHTAVAATRVESEASAPVASAPTYHANTAPTLAAHSAYRADTNERTEPQADNKKSADVSTSSFEDRLAKIFEAQQASKSKESHGAANSDTRSVASKGNDYRYQQSLEQINQLKKSLEELKSEKNSALPANTASASSSGGEPKVAPRITAFKGLENNNSPSAAPSSNISAHSATPTRSAASASGSGGGSVSSSSSSNSSAAPSAIETTASKSSGFGGFKSSGGGSNFTLSREEVGQGEKVIIPASTFNAEDGEYLKKLYEQTKGEPIFLSQTDATGREQFVMLEAVVKADGSIEYIPVDKKDSKEGKAEGKQRSKRKPSSQEATVEKNNKKRTKVDDLKSLLGEKL